MEKESKELIGIVVGKMLEPVTDAVQTVFGIVGVDYLKEIRKRNADKFARITEKIIADRNIENATPPPPSILLPLVSAAENEGRDELLEMWARLMAAASDPVKLGVFRRDYIEIAKQLEPVDVLLLQRLSAMSGGVYDPTRLQYIEMQISMHRDQILVAFEKLKALQLIDGTFLHRTSPELTPLGRQFMKTQEQ